MDPNDLNVLRHKMSPKKGLKNLISWKVRTNPDNEKFDLRKYKSYNDLGSILRLPAQQ